MYTTLTACATKVTDYRDTQPTLDLQTFFQGPIKAWGMFQGRDGKVKRRFTVDIDASWQGDTGVLNEYFTYDDGETQTRIWTITKHSQNEYSGKAEDVVGKAKGEAHGYALSWKYTLELPVGDKVYKVNFDDWMYLLDENTLVNRAKVKKFGARVGEVTLFFKRI